MTPRLQSDNQRVQQQNLENACSGTHSSSTYSVLCHVSYVMESKRVRPHLIREKILCKKYGNLNKPSGHHPVLDSEEDTCVSHY